MDLPQSIKIIKDTISSKIIYWLLGAIIFINVSKDNRYWSLLTFKNSLAIIISNQLFENEVPLTKIHLIQGKSKNLNDPKYLVTKLENEIVWIEGVVTRTLSSNHSFGGGYFIQGAKAQWDADILTSEGIFVYDASVLAVGDYVRVKGRVKEHKLKTELVDVRQIQLISSDQIALTQAIDFDFSIHPEAFEGMWVKFPRSKVIRNDLYGRYGQLAVRPVDASGNKAQFDFNIWIEDGDSSLWPKSNQIIPLNVSVRNTELEEFYGVIDFQFGRYVVIPDNPVQANKKNYLAAISSQRPKSKENHSIRIATINCDNLFSVKSAQKLDRGPQNIIEYNTKLERLAATINLMDSDIVVLTELQRLQESRDSPQPLAELTELINRISDTDKFYRFILHPSESSASGVREDSSVLTQGYLYRTNRVQALGQPKSIPLTMQSFYYRGSIIERKHRPAILQIFTFENGINSFDLGIAANHWLSKANRCQENYQSNRKTDNSSCWKLKLETAKYVSGYLQKWKEQNNLDGVILAGDLNTGVKEPAISWLLKNGFYNALGNLERGEPYSYVYRGEANLLDYLLTSGIEQRKLAAGIWHINADFPSTFGYQTNEYYNRYPKQPPKPWVRSSDHDPVYLDIRLEGFDHGEP